MSRQLSFYAIATDAQIPEDIRKIFYDRLDVRDVFGTKCYVLVQDDDKSPLNLLDEETHRRVERWLHTVGDNAVFAYSWI